MFFSFFSNLEVLFCHPPVFFLVIADTLLNHQSNCYVWRWNSAGEHISPKALMPQKKKKHWFYDTFLYLKPFKKKQKKG